MPACAAGIFCTAPKSPLIPLKVNLCPGCSERVHGHGGCGVAILKTEKTNPKQQSFVLMCLLCHMVGDDSLLADPVPKTPTTTMTPQTKRTTRRTKRVTSYSSSWEVAKTKTTLTTTHAKHNKRPLVHAPSLRSQKARTKRQTRPSSSPVVRLKESAANRLARECSPAYRRYQNTKVPFCVSPDLRGSSTAPSSSIVQVQKVIHG